MPAPFSLIEMLGDLVPHLHFVDIGAMDLGPDHVPYRELIRPGKTTIVGFEPLRSECEKLNALAAPGQKYLPYCIGDGTERNFYITNTGFTSSLYEPNTDLLRAFNNLAELMRVQGVEKLQTVRLDDVREIEDVHFLKLDVQGAELDVLRNSLRLLKNTMLVYTEVEYLELYKGQPLFGDIHEFLRQQGFMLHFVNGFGGRAYSPVSAGRDINMQVRQALWSDAIFVPDFRRLHEYAPERLLALAVMLHELFVSVDLAAVALNHYDRKMGTDLWTEYLRRLTGTAPTGKRPALSGLDPLN
ncbi:MAG: FkbM family methyltransferase [Phycisphaerae bacterium]|nr:FkbM family methyltransferase [Phycisphaerae bacterium]MBN8598644.1 FkbM family methyltransferase [Planctomycetota bacterium]